MKWRDAATDRPSHHKPVLGLILNTPINAEWSWSTPHAYVFDGSRWRGSDDSRLMAPTVWAEIDWPALPHSGARAMALRECAKDNAYETEKAALDKKYGRTP